VIEAKTKFPLTPSMQEPERDFPPLSVGVRFWLTQSFGCPFRLLLGPSLSALDGARGSAGVVTC
jgi:hypothetical protein